ncbi:MAG: hypothetical protein LBQ94_03675 [Treponema sp.]|nr:hypothetical protein [Treponema sp.]
MNILRKTEKNADDFWREYEEKTGEKVLAHGLGRYVSGWDEFDSNRWTSLWGLIIACTGGFRFHNFPQRSWLDSLVNWSGQEEPKEKTIFIPKERIISTQLVVETNWWKKLFVSSPPQLFIDYHDGDNTRRLLVEVEIGAKDPVFSDLVGKLNSESN